MTTALHVEAEVPQWPPLPSVILGRIRPSDDGRHMFNVAVRDPTIYGEGTACQVRLCKGIKRRTGSQGFYLLHDVPVGTSKILLYVSYSTVRCAICGAAYPPTPLPEAHPSLPVTRRLAQYLKDKADLADEETLASATGVLPLLVRRVLDQEASPTISSSWPGPRHWQPTKAAIVAAVLAVATLSIAALAADLWLFSAK